MIVLSSNQNQAQAEDTEICPTLVASMGMGGGYVPMIVVQRRFSNVRVSDAEVCYTLEASGGTGGGNVPIICFSAGFCPEESARTRGIGYQVEVSPSLRQGVTPAVVSVLAIHEATGQDTTFQRDVAYSLVTGGGMPGQGRPCVLIIGEKEDDNSNRKTIL